MESFAEVLVHSVGPPPRRAREKVSPPLVLAGGEFQPASLHPEESVKLPQVLCGFATVSGMCPLGHEDSM
jgi:hypothetical protein